MLYNNRKPKFTLRSSCRALEGCQWWQARGGAETAELMVGNYESVSKKYDEKYDVKYDKYNKVVLANWMAKEDWGICNLPRANTPQATIGSRARSNDTRTPRVRGSRGRRFCQALPAGLQRDMQRAQTGVCATKHLSAPALAQAPQ